jgi:Svf1-like N-terminal lipocalin domain
VSRLKHSISCPMMGLSPWPRSFTAMLGQPSGSLHMQVLIGHRGIRTTCQFNIKIFNHSGPFNHLWCSDPLTNYGFDEGQYCFYADNLAVELNDAGTSFTIKAAVNENSIVNITLTRAAPGFQVGKDGTSYFGTDPSHPWGSMRHAFWPRCDVEGSIVTKEKKYDMRGRALFIHALQGMKPHHAGWLFRSCKHSSLTLSSCKMELR